MSTSVVNTAELRSDDKIVDENDQELPVGTVMHCLGALSYQFREQAFHWKN